MPVSSIARHRAVGHPTTSLSDLAAATGNLAAVGGRSALAVASSGMLMTMLAAPASAAPAAMAAVPAVDTSGLTASARAALAPRVTVAADAVWSLDVPAGTIVADPPARTRVKKAPVKLAAPASAPASANGRAILEIAARYVGVPYVWGGTTPNGFDCSGFTSYVFAQVGISLPRTSAAQRNAGTVVSRADARPGDLVMHPGHVAIYAGDGQLIDAPMPGGAVHFRPIYFSNPVFVRVT